MYPFLGASHQQCCWGYHDVPSNVSSSLSFYDKLIIPIFRIITRSDVGINVLQRMGIGIFLSFLSMVVAALVEAKRLETDEKGQEVGGGPESETVPMSIFWLVPQYVLLGMSDVFTVVGMQEFFYSQVPSGRRTTEWKEFAENVSGEWDGFGADFTIEGSPIELPESVVPEAFREWEVKVFDWQFQCPTLAETDRPMLLYKLIKLLPTVGCEADAATQYSIDERTIGGANDKLEVFAYHPSGCYVAVWPVEDKGTYRLMELEHCLVNPENRESRTRIVQVVRVENAIVKLENIRVSCEQWYGPFRNGEQLGGCAIRDSGFASTDALKISEIIGSWKGVCSASSFDNPRSGVIQELVDEKPQRLTRNHLGVTLLPKQLWCSVEGREHGESSAEVGWLLDSGRALTSRCVFLKDGKLKKIEICRETEVPE